MTTGHSLPVEHLRFHRPNEAFHLQAIKQTTSACHRPNNAGLLLYSNSTKSAVAAPTATMIHEMGPLRIRHIDAHLPEYAAGHLDTWQRKRSPARNRALKTAEDEARA